MKTILFISLWFLHSNHLDAQREHVSDEKIRFQLKDASYLNTYDGGIYPNITTGFRPFDYTWTGPDQFISFDSVLHTLKSGIYIIRIEDALCGKFSDTIELKAIQNELVNPSLNLLKISPNPFTTEINLSIESNQPQSIELSLYNSRGEKYLNKLIQLNIGMNNLLLDMHTAPPGSYIIHLIGGDHVALIDRIIKSN